MLLLLRDVAFFCHCGVDGVESILDSHVRRGFSGLHFSEGDEKPGHPVQISGPQTLRLSLPLPGTSGGKRCRLHVSLCVRVCLCVPVCVCVRLGVYRKSIGEFLINDSGALANKDNETHW